MFGSKVVYLTSHVPMQLFGRIFEAFRYNTFLSFCDYVQKVYVMMAT